MRRFTPWLALSLFALWPSLSVRAAGVATFRLMNVDSPGAAPVQEVLARIIPAGSIVPRNPSTDPPSILEPSTGYVSSGFNPNDLNLTLGDGTTSTGDPFQVLKLDFGTGGLAPGGKLFFQLNQSPNYDGLVRLVLPNSVTNIALERLDNPPIDLPGGGSNNPPQVPEPVSLLLWGGATGLALLRARAFRASQRT